MESDREAQIQEGKERVLAMLRKRNQELEGALAREKPKAPRKPYAVTYPPPRKIQESKPTPKPMTPAKPTAPPKPKGRPKFSREEKLDYAIKKGALPAEESIQKLSWAAGQEQAEIISGKLDHKVWWILLVAARKIVENGEPIFDRAEEVGMAESDLKKFPVLSQQKDFLPSIDFDDDEFRRILHKPDLTSPHILGIVENLAKLTVKTPKVFKAVKIRDGIERVTYSQCIGHIAWAQVEGTRIRDKGRWKGKEIRKYRVYFNTMPGLAFYQNITSHAFTLIENHKNFLALPGPEQTLFLSISWRGDLPAILKFDQILNILGWERWSSGNHCRQRKTVERLLDRLKEGGWIASWQRLQGEVYRIFKADFNRRMVTKNSMTHDEK